MPTEGNEVLGSLVYLLGLSERAFIALWKSLGYTEGEFTHTHTQIPRN